MEFKDRIKRLRIEKGLLQKEVAEAIGVNRMTITEYEGGKREPNIDKLIKLSNFFECSIDYLIGISDEKKTASQLLIAVKKMKELNIKELKDLISLIDEF